MSVTRIRHDKNHWQKLVERQSVSGLSGAEFCRQHDIRYASFMAWRKRLQPNSLESSVATPNTFVELTAPMQPNRAVHSDETEQSNLCVELSLGAGIELRIIRRG